jgi:hypothetical protein
MKPRSCSRCWADVAGEGDLERGSRTNETLVLLGLGTGHGRIRDHHTDGTTTPYGRGPHHHVRLVRGASPRRARPCGLNSVPLGATRRCRSNRRRWDLVLCLRSQSVAGGQTLWPFRSSLGDIPSECGPIPPRVWSSVAALSPLWPKWERGRHNRDPHGSSAGRRPIPGLGRAALRRGASEVRNAAQQPYPPVKRESHRTFSFKAASFRGLGVVTVARDGELNGADCKRISGL